MSTITALDGSGATTTPFAIDGFEAESESGNVVHRLIAPGAIAVTLVGDLPRTGTLRLIYTDDTAAEAARTLLGRSTSFALSTPERPVISMTFVRTGKLGAALRDKVRSLWSFAVEFQEVDG